jgi:predicted aspartyl protease
LFYRFSYRFLLILGVIAILSIYSSHPDDIASTNTGRIIDLVRGSEDVYDDTRSSMPPETDLVTIPLKSAGRLFMIEAIIDNQSGNLIFDSGATGLVMNLTYFRKYVKMNLQNATGITGSVIGSGSINLGKIKISELSFTNVPAALADLGHIENQRGVKVLGLIGLEYFKEFEIMIDAANNELQLHRIDTKGRRVNNSADNFQPDISEPIEILKNIVFVKGSVGGKVLRFCLDTGAETNAISNHASRSVLATISVDRKSNLGGAGQRSVEVLFGTMNDFEFGKHQR